MIKAPVNNPHSTIVKNVFFKNRTGNMRKNWWLILLILPLLLEAQTSRQALSLDDFLHQVKQNHPLALQAGLARERASREVQQARGAFDPVAQFNYDNKRFRDKNYYGILESELKLPTRLGLDFKAGYDRSSGIYLNPEYTLPPGGLAYAGLSLPLGQGLFIDEERANLRQAMIRANAAAFEQTALLNDLLFEAAQVYWNWYAADREAAIYREAVAVAETRLEATIQTYLLGDRPALDTLEALLLLQSRQVDLADAQLRLQKAALALSNFFWDNNSQPAPAPDSLLPTGAAGFALLPLDNWQQDLAELPASHPILSQYNLKLDALGVERRWKREKLKPKLDLSYNFLAEPVGGEVWSDLAFSNTKWGLSFKYPLLLRSERSGVAITNLKIQETQLDLEQKQLALQNKAAAYAAEWQNLGSQLATVESATGNYRLLLEGELERFNFGESTLFLVNTRENKLLEAQVKQVAVQVKRELARAGFFHAMGRLPGYF